MATSGSTDYNVTGKEVINGAIRIVRGIGGKTTGGKSAQIERSQAMEALEMMIKSWQANGIGLWKNSEVYVFLSYEGYSYSLGPSGDEATETLVETEVATAADSGDSTVVVDSITGMSDLDNVGVQLDDGTLQWTTINGTPASATITLTTVLTDDVAVDNNVYTYTSGISRPFTISEARLVRDSGTETPLEIVTREEYMRIANKTSTGKASIVYYDPQLTDGVLKVWPAADSVADYIKLTARMPIEDVDAETYNLDFAVEWLRPLKFNLASEIMWEYTGIDPKEKLLLENKASSLKDELEQFDAEHGSIYIEADDVK